MTVSECGQGTTFTLFIFVARGKHFLHSLGMCIFKQGGINPPCNDGECTDLQRHNRTCMVIIITFVNLSVITQSLSLAVNHKC